LTAFFTGVGLVVAIGALWVAYVTYNSADKQAELKTTADAMSEWSLNSSANVPHCITFLSTFDVEGLGEIVARHEVPYPAERQDELLACLSDLPPHDLSALVDQHHHMLTRRGASVVTGRVNAELDKDAVVAGLMVNGIGRQDILLKEIGWIICRDDPKLIQTLRQIPGREKSFNAIQEFIGAQPPLGCR
jgi:hypothetical protein